MRECPRLGAGRVARQNPEDSLDGEDTPGDLDGRGGWSGLDRELHRERELWGSAEGHPQGFDGTPVAHVRKLLGAGTAH